MQTAMPNGATSSTALFARARLARLACAVLGCAQVGCARSCARPSEASPARGDEATHEAALARAPDGGSPDASGAQADTGAATSLRPWWTAATTLREPPVRLAAGVTGIVAHVPEGYDARAPIHLILYFHGSDSCALQLAEAGDVVCKPGEERMVGAALDARHDDAGTQSLFALPQFVLWGGGSAGRMVERGYFRSFVQELLGETFAPGLGGPRGVDDLADITLIGHSAGKLPLRAILERGDLADKIRNVVLIDGLFDDPGTYIDWLGRGEDRKFVAVYGAWGDQAAHGRAIAAQAARRGAGDPSRAVAVDPPGSFEQAIRAHAVTVKLWPGVEHGWMQLLMLTKIVSALDLPRRRIVPTREPVAGHVSPPAPLAIGETVDGTLRDGDTTLENGAAADDYTFALAPPGSGNRVVIDVRGGRSWTEGCCKLDVYAQLFDGAGGGALVAADDDSGGLFDSRIEYVAPAAGPFTVRVTTAGSGRKTGPYTLRVREVGKGGGAP
jgi:hypothetical protein